MGLMVTNGQEKTLPPRRWGDLQKPFRATLSGRSEMWILRALDKAGRREAVLVRTGKVKKRVS
jgi:hypothetical protein